MEEIHIHDNILHNILARLPGKPLLRFRCVSKHWNRLISDPYFMKSRSRKMILLKYPPPLTVIDVINVPADDDTVVKIQFPLKSPEECLKNVMTVGTFNGIVLLVLTDMSFRDHMYLYNPLTSASKKLLVMDTPYSTGFPYLYGFGYGAGATIDDLKIVRFGPYDEHRQYICDVFNLKTSSWSKSPQYIKRDFIFCGDVGMFLNGVLYWVVSSFNMGILALDVKEMVFSNINLPRGRVYKEITRPTVYEYFGALLGSLNGCLCLVDKENSRANKFDVWVMNEKDPWVKACTFTLGLEGDIVDHFHPMCIMSNGKILLINVSNQIFIYDTNRHSCKALHKFESHGPYWEIRTYIDYKRLVSIEYVESLVSPLDMTSQ